MKNFFNGGIRVEKLKYITVVYPVVLESVKLMVHEHYDNAEYDDTLFLINTIGYYIDLSSSDYNQHRCIYYNFEHSLDFDLNEKPRVIEYINNYRITEIWSFEPNCEMFDTDLGVKYMPVRYTSFISKPEYRTEPKFDLGFIGIVGSDDSCPRRNKFFDKYIRSAEHGFSLKILNGYPLSELHDELANCRFILDSHRNYRHSMQNQVRIFESLCSSYTVLAEKSEYNIFPGLVYEWNNIDELNEFINTVEPKDLSEKYKEMTYTDEAYEEYRHKIIYDNYNKPTNEYFDKCGIKRYDLINRLINKFNFKTYLEIGVFNGENFKEINCETKVSVDPVPGEYVTNTMTSDEYFATLSEDTKFDLIFIDGLHLWEQCYRDINNALNHLSPNGVIVCHDMNPLYELYSSRVQFTYWNGDVWKSFVKVRSERSDIHCCMIEDCDFGLGIITNGCDTPIELNKPAETLTYQDDFAKNKKYLMNTISINDFITRNDL